MSKIVRDILVNLLCGSAAPLVLLILYLTGTIAWYTFKICLLLCLVFFVIFPLVYKFSYSLQRQVVFLNSVNIPLNPNYQHPENYGLVASRNFYLSTEDGVSLGVWHVLPETLVQRGNYTDLQDFEKLLGNGQDVVIYNHGNSGNRITEHRRDLYRLLRKLNFHVIAYDYRSYGDSSPVYPTELGVVNDAMSVFRWVANRTNGNIFVWGHSLGSSISLHSLARLKHEGLYATGVVLEGAFNNMKDEISEFPLARMFKNLPWFSYTVVEPMQQNNFKFQSDIHISNVDCPIMMLHAEDDNVVPFKLGSKLYDTAIKQRSESQGKVIFHKFEGHRKFGHKFICRAEELPKIVKEFTSEAIKENNKKHIRKL